MKFKPLPPMEVLRDLFAYDRETGELIWRERGQSKMAGCSAAHIYPGERYLHTFITNFGKYKTHRVAYALANGRPPVEEVDHIDGNSLNNSAANLREATRRENCWNLTGRSKYGKGVKRQKTGKPFAAWITVDGRKTYLGCYDTAEDAQANYQRAAEMYFGDFASTRCASSSTG